MRFKKVYSTAEEKNEYMNRIGKLLSDTESLIIFGVIVVATIIAVSVTGKFFQKMLRKKTASDEMDMTSFFFIKHIISATMYLFGFGWALLTLPISKNFAHSLFAGAGLTTLILGFASQQILGNLISGFFLIIRRPFRINDIIEIQGNKGRVIEIDLHATTIEDEKKDLITIPNSILSNGIIRNVKNGSQGNK